TVSDLTNDGDSVGFSLTVPNTAQPGSYTIYAYANDYATGTGPWFSNNVYVTIGSPAENIGAVLGILGTGVVSPSTYQQALQRLTGLNILGAGDQILLLNGQTATLRITQGNLQPYYNGGAPGRVVAPGAGGTLV